MNKPPPPVRRSPSSRTATSSVAAQPVEPSKDDSDKSRNVAIALIVGGGLTLCLLLLLCAGAAGAGLALSGSGSGDSQGEASGDGAAADTSQAVQQNTQSGTSQETEESESENQNQTVITEEGDSEESNPESQDQSQSESSDPQNGGATAGGSSGAGLTGSTFFGITASGDKIVYIVDSSGSMDGAPFEKAKAELMRSIRGLLVNQQFLVIFFSDGAYPMFYPSSGGLVRCTDENVAKTERWVNNFPAIGGTEPLEALMNALRINPTTIFLLTDGEFDSGIPATIKKANGSNTKINTISFISKAGEPLLKRIANDSEGTYSHVP